MRAQQDAEVLYMHGTPICVKRTYPSERSLWVVVLGQLTQTAISVQRSTRRQLPHWVKRLIARLDSSVKHLIECIHRTGTLKTQDLKIPKI